MRRALLLLLASSLAVAPLAASAATAGAPRTFSDLTTQIITVMSSLTFVLMLAGIAVYFWGLSINVMKIAKGETSQMRSYFLWGVIVLFVMVSIWGIVQILQNTLFSGDIGAGSTSSGSGLCQTFGDPGCGSGN